VAVARKSSSSPPDNSVNYLVILYQSAEGKIRGLSFFATSFVNAG
jgi:hypothetical protein